MNTSSRNTYIIPRIAQQGRTTIPPKPIVITLFCAAMVLPATAFGFGLDEENLSQEQISGALNGPQNAAANTIQGPVQSNGERPAPNPDDPAGLCPDLIGRNNSGELAGNTAALNFLDRCTELILSAHPGVIAGTEDFELGIGDDAIRSALQQVVPEETEIIGAGATDTSHDQLANISSRLQYLRTGTSTLPIAGIYYGDALTGGTAGAEGYNRWGFFINGNYGTGEKDATFNENGFEYDAYGVTVGVDYRFNDNVVAGIALGLANSDVDIDDNAGDYDTDGENVALYALYNGDRYYVEGTLTFGSYEHEGRRNISYGPVALVANSETDGDQVAWSLGAGFTTQKDSWNFNLYGRVEGLEADVDGYDETGAASQNTEWLIHVDDQDIDSLQAILGVQAAYASSQNYGVLQPYASIEAHHEFDDDSRAVTAFYLADPGAGSLFPIQLQTDKPDEDFFLLTLGTTLVLKGGNQLFLNYDTVLGLDDVDSHGVTVGLRVEF